MANHPAVKHGLLEVPLPPGPVLSRASAEAMATNDPEEAHNQRVVGISH